MKVFGLDNRQHVLNTALYRRQSNNCSQQHIRARAILKELFSLNQILEEVSLPGTSKLTADFFIPDLRLIIEVNGQQHYKYVKHFHGNKKGFQASKQRDNNKKTWCELNQITLIELNSLESDDEWRTKLSS